MPGGVELRGKAVDREDVEEEDAALAIDPVMMGTTHGGGCIADASGTG